MNFKSLKQTIYLAMQRENFRVDTLETEDSLRKAAINKIIASILLFNIVESMIGRDDYFLSKASQLAEKYSGTYKNIAITMEQKYVSYRNMFRKVESFKLNSFLDITKNQIDQIVDIYNNRKIIKPFSISGFSVEMYKVSNLGYDDTLRLHTTHDTIIVPIAQHYRTFNNISFTDIDVIDQSSGKAGKDILITIKNISPAKLAADVDLDVIGIKTKLYKYELTSDGYVRLLVK